MEVEVEAEKRNTLYLCERVVRARFFELVHRFQINRYTISLQALEANSEDTQLLVGLWEANGDAKALFTVRVEPALYGLSNDGAKSLDDDATRQTLHDLELHLPGGKYDFSFFENSHKTGVDIVAICSMDENDPIATFLRPHLSAAVAQCYVAIDGDIECVTMHVHPVKSGACFRISFSIEFSIFLGELTKGPFLNCAFFTIKAQLKLKMQFENRSLVSLVNFTQTLLQMSGDELTNGTVSVRMNLSQDFLVSVPCEWSDEEPGGKRSRLLSCIQSR